MEVFERYMAHRKLDVLDVILIERPVHHGGPEERYVEKATHNSLSL